MSSINPATGEALWKGKEATSVEIDAAIIKAQKTFENWSQRSMDDRIAILRNFQEILKESKEAYAETISKENGKPFWEARNEVESMIAKIDSCIEAYKERCKELTRDKPGIRSITRHKPHGVVAVFGPFNFPGHLPHGHIAPALLAGNTIVFKPSELTPWVAEETLKLWKKAGLPDGTLNIVQGGVEVGKYLIQHPGINGIFFTGSWKTGNIISEQLVHQPQKILALELGGNNPLIIGAVEDLDAAAYHTVQSAYLTSGQRCTCARRLIVPKDEKGDLFIAKLQEMIKGIRVGKYNDSPEPFMGPLISINAANKVMEAQSNLLKIGGKALIKMEQKGVFLTPGLIDVTPIKDRPDEEYFGPLLQVIRVENLESAIAEANNTSYGLTAGVLTDSPQEHEQVLKHVRAGIINWNTQITGAYGSAPFGGLGQSGNFRPSGYYACDYCSYPVASLESDKLTLPKTFSPGLTK